MTIKPQIRDCVSYAAHTAIELLLQGTDQRGAMKSCINCHKFDEATEMCQMFKARPPARVIAFGCDRHDDIDEIPF